MSDMLHLVVTRTYLAEDLRRETQIREIEKGLTLYGSFLICVSLRKSSADVFAGQKSQNPVAMKSVPKRGSVGSF